MVTKYIVYNTKVVAGITISLVEQLASRRLIGRHSSVGTSPLIQP